MAAAAGAPLERFTLLETLKQFEKPIGAACALDPGCRRIQAGYLLSQIVGILKQARDGVQPPPKMYLFSSHTEVVFSLMKLLDYAKPERTLTPTSGFIIEYRETAYPEIRFVQHNGVAFLPRDREVRLAERRPQCRIGATGTPPQGGTIIDWCPLLDIIRRVSDRLISDVDAACQTEDLQPINIISLAQSGEFTDRITAAWAMTAGDAARVSRYELTYSPVGDRQAAQTIAVDASANTFTIPGLDPGRSYNIELVAIGQNGLSDSAEEIMRTIAVSLVEIVSLAQVEATTSAIKVMWAIDPESEPLVENFVVAINPSVDPSQVTEQTVEKGLRMYRFTGLRPGTRYDISVLARTASGNGASRRDVYSTLEEVVVVTEEVTETTSPGTSQNTCEPIRIISVDKIKSDSAGLLLGWAVLPENVPRVESFQIFLTPLVEPEAVKEIQIRRPEFTQLVPDLAPETIYNVTIRAVASCAPNSPAFSVWIITDRFDVYEAPPPPPPPPVYSGPKTTPQPPATPVAYQPSPPPTPPPTVPPTVPPRVSRPPPSSYGGFQPPSVRTAPPAKPAGYAAPAPPRSRPQPRPNPARSYSVSGSPGVWTPPRLGRPLAPAAHGQGYGNSAPRPRSISYVSGPGSWEIEANLVSLKRSRSPGRRRGPGRIVEARRLSECRDVRPLCPRWAKAGHCLSNPFFMNLHCQRSCNCCGCTVADLAAGKGGPVTKGGSPPSASPPSKRPSGASRASLKISKSSKTSSSSESPEEEDDDCFDFNEDCPFWAVAGECESNARFMRNVCPASCRRCRPRS